jgi:hypothetical protein
MAPTNLITTPTHPAQPDFDSIVLKFIEFGIKIKLVV